MEKKNVMMFTTARVVTSTITGKDACYTSMHTHIDTIRFDLVDVMMSVQTSDASKHPYHAVILMHTINFTLGMMLIPLLHDVLMCPYDQLNDQLKNSHT